MPYIENKSRPYFDEHPTEAKLDGDLAYVLYKKIVLPTWKAEPRWKTYALLRKGAKDVRRVPGLLDLVKGLASNGVDLVDISVAYDAAVDEVKRRFVDNYEDLKIKDQGDIE